jgi:hypothetical protein
MASGEWRVVSGEWFFSLNPLSPRMSPAKVNICKNCPAALPIAESQRSLLHDISAALTGVETWFEGKIAIDSKFAF